MKRFNKLEIAVLAGIGTLCVIGFWQLCAWAYEFGEYMQW